MRMICNCNSFSSKLWTSSSGAPPMSPETAREIADELAAGDSADLCPGLAERTLLYGFRRMASGNDQCPATRREFAAALGPLAEDALAAFRCFFWTLAAF